MPDALDRARNVIEERLHELEDETKKLRNALARLADQDGRKPMSKSARPASRRAPRGQRQHQLLASIEKHPEYRPSEHAKAMRVSPNQVYALARKLQEQETIEKTAAGTYRLNAARTEKSRSAGKSNSLTPAQKAWKTRRAKGDTGTNAARKAWQTRRARDPEAGRKAALKAARTRKANAA